MSIKKNPNTEKFEFNAYLFPSTVSETRERLEKINFSENVSFDVSLGENGVVISVSCETESSAEAAEKLIKDSFKATLFSTETGNFAEAVVKRLIENKIKISVAESCTGGLLSKKITDIPGASSVFEMGLTTYSNEAKNVMLDVPEDVLNEKGAVSREVAMHLAVNVRAAAGSNIGVGITGIAGPDGGSEEKPVGLVYIGVATEDGYWTEELRLGEGKARELIRNETTLFALYMINQALNKTEGYKKAIIPYEKEDNSVLAVVKRGLKKAYEYLLPLKIDSKAEKIRKIVFLSAIVIFLGSGIYIGNYFYTRLSNDRKIEKLQTQLDIPATPEEIENLPEGYLEKFASLYSINSDVVGWIKISDTIDLPVVRFTDNDYYLKKDFYKKDNYHGVPFMDYRCNASLTTTNTVIYGHNVKPDRMFASLLNYKKLAYYKQNPVFTFDSVYEESEWKILYVMIVDGESSRGEYFDYHNFINAQSDKDFYDFIEKCKRRTLINTTVDVNPTDKLLTLSTCGFDFNGERIVVVARRVRNGEDSEVDVKNAYANPKVQLPDIWYQIWGGEKPVFPSSSVVEESSSAPESNASSDSSSDTSSDTVSSETNSSSEVSSDVLSSEDVSSEETSSVVDSNSSSEENSSSE